MSSAATTRADNKGSSPAPFSGQITPALDIWLKTTGFVQTQVIYAIKKTGVADALGAGPKTADELSKELDLHTDPLYRVLRAAVNFGVLAVAPGTPPRFEHTEGSRMLMDSHPATIWPMVEWTIADGYGTLTELDWVVKTGGNAFRKTHNGQTLWEILKEDHKREHDFSRAMVATDDMASIDAVIAEYPWSRYKRFVDIAGAYGSFLARLLKHVKAAEGVIFDQPQVIDRSRKLWSEEADKAALRERTSFVAGDFFKSETLPKPREGDVWVLRFILHDWNDDDAARILAALRGAMGTTPVTLCICEARPPQMERAGAQFAYTDEFGDPCKNFAKCAADLMVMTMLASGRERTRAEFEKLFTGAGFKLNRVVETRGPMCVLEAVPV